MAAYDVVKTVIIRKAHVVGDNILSGVKSNDMQKHIDAAMQEYSQDEPDRVVLEKDTSAVVDSEFPLNNANIGFDWERRTSHIVEVENPRDQPEKSVMIPDRDYRLQEKTTGVFVIRFFINPADWRLVLERDWDIDRVEADPIATERVGILSAAKTARQKAAQYSDTNDPNLLADVVDYKNKGSLWLDVAEALETEYQRAVNRPLETKRASSVVATTDLDLSFQGERRRNYLVHRRRTR